MTRGRLELFFWAWWIAWASFVGLFLARISRGRTIRQFVAGTLIIPFTYVLMWVSIFGNSAIDIVRSGNAGFGELAMNTPERGFYTPLTEYPACGVVAGVATFVGLLFYVTSADSAALVMANLSSKLRTPQDDATTGARIFWAMATGRVEAYRADSRRQALPGLLSGRSAPGQADASGRDWRLRLTRAMAFPDTVKAQEYLDEVALPALQEVADELRSQDVEAAAHKVPDDGSSYVELVTDVGSDHPFQYQIWPREVPTPVYGRRTPRGRDMYCRLEVPCRRAVRATTSWATRTRSSSTTCSTSTNGTCRSCT